MAATAQTIPAQTEKPSTPAAATGSQAKPATPSNPDAQPPKPSPAKPAVREMPPDMKAYNDAVKITDPGKKIEALEKWKKDFATSSMLTMGDRTILSTLVEKFPDQQDRIRKFGAEMYRGAEPNNRAAMAGQIADQLLAGGVLLKDAENYAEKSLDSMTFEQYVESQSAAYRKRKQAPPWTSDLEKRYKQMRAQRLATLGRIEFKLGKNGKAQRLLEEARATLPENSGINTALGEIAAKNGNTGKALEYLVPARLGGSKDSIAPLEAVYKQTHNGSLDGFDAMLDGEYRKLYPNPLHLDAYKPAQKRTDRVVLAELFTGAGCPPCVAADLAFDAALERYSRKELVVIAYHEHIPRPDPMTNPDTQVRLKSHEVNGVPTYVVDGEKTVGGGPREYTKETYARFNKQIEQELDAPAEAMVKLQAAVDGNTVKVNASVDSVKSDSKNLKLHIALVEKELRYSGENGIRFHANVVRAMGGEKAAGFAVDRTGGRFEQSFDLDAISKAIKTHLDEYEAGGHRGETFKFMEKKYQIDRGDLAVVAFVQDDKTKHVLQAAYVDLGAPGGTRTVTETRASK